jgi:hypothetical protein
MAFATIIALTLDSRNEVNHFGDDMLFAMNNSTEIIPKIEII